jgi:hypothetical protein
MEDSRYHPFQDLSRRKPYICGICRRDITHPYHQPRLEGATVYVAPDRTEPASMFEPEPEPEPSQMRLF